MKKIFVCMIACLLVCSSGSNSNSRDLFSSKEKNKKKTEIYKKQLQNSSVKNLYAKPGSDSEEKLYKLDPSKLKKKKTDEVKIPSEVRTHINAFKKFHKNEISSFKKSIIEEIQIKSIYAGTSEVSQINTGENQIRKSLNIPEVKKPVFEINRPTMPSVKKPVFEKPEGFEKPDLDDPDSFNRPNFIPGQE